MTVGLIIAITAVLAIPFGLLQMREYRARQVAQEIAGVYLNAKARAKGRGCVMVRYNETSGFSVMESIEGTQAVTRTYDECAPGPGFGCLSTDWADPANVRAVTEFHPPESDLVVQMLDSGGVAKTDFAMSFSPSGRSFVSYDGSVPTAPLSGSVTFTIQRPTGLLRKVTLLGNGNARLAL
jgi:hypothetical protein